MTRLISLRTQGTGASGHRQPRLWRALAGFGGVCVNPPHSRPLTRSQKEAGKDATAAAVDEEEAEYETVDKLEVGSPGSSRRFGSLTCPIE